MLRPVKTVKRTAEWNPLKRQRAFSVMADKSDLITDYIHIYILNPETKMLLTEVGNLGT